MNALKKFWSFLINFVFPIISFWAAASALGIISGNVSITINEGYTAIFFAAAVPIFLLILLARKILKRRLLHQCYPRRLLSVTSIVKFTDPGDGKPYPQATHTKKTRSLVLNGNASVIGAHAIQDECSNELKNKVTKAYEDYKVSAKQIGNGNRTIPLHPPTVRPLDERKVSISVDAKNTVKKDSVIEFEETYTADRDQYPGPDEYFQSTIVSLTDKCTIEIWFGNKEPDDVMFQLFRGQNAAPTLDKVISLDKIDGEYVAKYTYKKPSIGDKLRLAWNW